MPLIPTVETAQRLQRALASNRSQKQRSQRPLASNRSIQHQRCANVGGGRQIVPLQQQRCANVGEKGEQRCNIGVQLI